MPNYIAGVYSPKYAGIFNFLVLNIFVSLVYISHSPLYLHPRIPSTVISQVRMIVQENGIQQKEKSLSAMCNPLLKRLALTAFIMPTSCLAACIKQYK